MLKLPRSEDNIQSTSIVHGWFRKLHYFLFFGRYSPKIRADIGRYAMINSITATSRHFTRKLGVSVSTSTVHSITQSYKRKRHEEGQDTITYLPNKKCGRPLLLSEDLDKAVQQYLHKVRESGGVVTARIAQAAAKGILSYFDRSVLTEFGGYLQLNLSWSYSLLQRMNFVRRKGTTSKSKHRNTNFEALKQG